MALLVVRTEMQCEERSRAWPILTRLCGTWYVRRRLVNREPVSEGLYGRTRDSHYGAPDHYCCAAAHCGVRRSCMAIGGSNNVRVVLLFLPSSAEGFIELDHGQKFVESRLRETQFRRKVVAVAGQYFQVAGCTAAVAQCRKARPIGS
jgi:hypothetical protein